MNEKQLKKIFEEIDGDHSYFARVTRRQITAFCVRQFFNLALIMTLPSAFRTRAPSSSASLLVLETKLMKISEEIEGNHPYFAIVTQHHKAAFRVHQFLELAKTYNISRRLPYTHPCLSYFAFSDRLETHEDVWRNRWESRVFRNGYPAPNNSILRTPILPTRQNNISRRFPYARPFLFRFAISDGNETQKDF